MGVFKYILDGAVQRQPISSMVTVDVNERKTISLYQMTAYGMCATLGAGIFVVAGSAGQEAGPSLLIAFVMCCISSSINAMLFAELGTAVPSSGSTFAYAYVSLGEAVAVCSAVMLFFEYGLSCAAVAQGCASYLIKAIPALDFLDYTHIGSLEVFPMAMIVMLIAIGVTMLGTANSTKIQVGFVIFNFCTIIAFICFGAQYVDFDNFTPFFPTGFGGTIRACSILFFSYIGFDAVTVVSHQAEKKGHVLKAMMGVLLGVTILYLLVSFVLVGMQPYYLLDVNTPLITAYELAANDSKGVISKLVGITAFIVTSMTTISVYGGTPRVIKAMAECRLAPKAFCFVQPADTTGHLNNTQLMSTDDKLTWFSVWTTSIFVIIMAGFVPFDSLIDATTIATLVSYSLVAICVIFEAKKSWGKGMPAQLENTYAASDASGAKKEAAVSPTIATTATPEAADGSVSEGSETSVAAKPTIDDLYEGQGVKEDLKMDILAATLVAFIAPCLFYCLQDWFGSSFWGGFTSLFIFLVAAVYITWQLWNSPSFLPKDRYRPGAFPILPLFVLLVNGVMCASMTIEGYYICFGSCIVGVLCWAGAKWYDFSKGEDNVGVPSKAF